MSGIARQAPSQALVRLLAFRGMIPSFLRGGGGGAFCRADAAMSSALGEASGSEAAWSQYSRMDSAPPLPGTRTNHRRAQLFRGERNFNA